MGWRREPQKRYGGEDYMAKRQRLYNEEQYAKRAYKKLSLWKKIKYHTTFWSVVGVIGTIVPTVILSIAFGPKGFAAAVITIVVTITILRKMKKG
jgi:hypothetical protein